MEPTTAPRPGQLSPRDFYRLRRALLEVEERELLVHWARHRLKRLSLELEGRYGLLGREAVLDLGRGEIREVKDEPGGHEDKGQEGPAR